MGRSRRVSVCSRAGPSTAIGASTAIPRASSFRFGVRACVSAFSAAFAAFFTRLKICARRFFTAFPIRFGASIAAKETAAGKKASEAYRAASIAFGLEAGRGVRAHTKAF